MDADHRAHWHLLPQGSPHDKTVHRRVQPWGEREGLCERLTQLAKTRREEGALDERERVIDATLAAATGGGDAVGLPTRGQGVTSLAMVDRQGLPLSGSPHAATHHEVTLGPLRFDCSRLEANPKPLSGDRASDRDRLDDALTKDGVPLMAPHRAPRTLKTQEGRPLRRAPRRWLVDRVCAWLHWKRRFLMRGEYAATNFLGAVQLAGITMLLKQF